MFWRNLSPPSSGLKSKPNKPAEAGGKLRLAYSSTMKMEAICSFKISNCL
jgi:hypothetical protein